MTDSNSILEVPAQTPLSMPCTAHAYPESIDYTWKKDGVLITAMTQNTYPINSVDVSINIVSISVSISAMSGCCT